VTVEPLFFVAQKADRLLFLQELHQLLDRFLGLRRGSHLFFEFLGKLLPVNLPIFVALQKSSLWRCVARPEIKMRLFDAAGIVPGDENTNSIGRFFGLVDGFGFKRQDVKPIRSLAIIFRLH